MLYGGASLVTQAKALEKKPQIVVATPGRLMDHYNRKNIRFDKVQTIILDEADRMLDMGFFKDVTRIVEKVKNRKNLGLFSATISQEVMTVSFSSNSRFSARVLWAGSDVVRSASCQENCRMASSTVCRSPS